MKRFEAIFHMGEGSDYEWDSTRDVYAEDRKEALDKADEVADRLMEQYGCHAELVELFESKD